MPRLPPYLAAIPALAFSLPAAAAEVRIQANAVLDEPFHYCFDLAGGPNNPDFTKPVGVHACKTGDFSDQLFEGDDVKAGRLRLPVYDKCLEAEPKAGATLMVAACSGAPTQKWTVAGDGQVRPAGSAGLCATVDAAPGRVAGSPPGVVYHVRGLALQACDGSTAAERQTWTVQTPAAPNQHNPPKAG